MVCSVVNIAVPSSYFSVSALFLVLLPAYLPLSECLLRRDEP